MRDCRTHRVIVFGRYPVPGKVKTRLIAACGAARAADLQRRLTEKAMATVRGAAARINADVEFRYEGGSERQMRRWLGPGLRLAPQAEGDLGRRMRAAFGGAFRQGARRVVLVGTDIPELTADHLARGLAALADHDVVLGPSTDGGYWLLGLKAPVPVFADVAWGTPAVRKQTLARVKGLGLSVYLLDPLPDVDTPEAVRRWLPDEAVRRPYVSVITAALNEAETIEAAMASARHADAETLVVDGGSTDGTVARATAAGARVIEAPRGRAVQQNRGAAVARGRVLLFLHADTRLPAGWVERVFEALMDARVACGAFTFKTDLDRPLMRAIERLTDVRSRRFHLPYGDQALFLPRERFLAEGGFPDVAIAEDLLLVRRLGRRGRICILDAPAVTSARRWQTVGVLKTSLINQVIVAGCLLGVSPHRLVRLYRGDEQPP